MEIEEGLAVTEQVVLLLDQMIKQGKELAMGMFGSQENIPELTGPVPDVNSEENTDGESEFIGYGKIIHPKSV